MNERKTAALLDDVYQLLGAITNGELTKDIITDDKTPPTKILELRLKAATTLLGKLAIMEPATNEQDTITITREQLEELRSTMLRKLARLADAQVSTTNAALPPSTTISTDTDAGGTVTSTP